jgi:hypothetical protein
MQGWMRRRLLHGAAVAWLVVGGSGCLATRVQHEDLEQRVVRLEKAHEGFLVTAQRETQRLQTLSNEVEASTGRLGELLAKSGAKLADFDTSLKKLSGRFEELDRRLAALEKSGGASAEQLADLRRRLEHLVADLRDRAGITILALPAELPTDPAGFAKLAETELAQGNVRTAAAVASECQKRFGGTEASGQCGLVLARLATEEQRYADATRLLQEVHDSLGGRPLPVVGQALVELAKVMWLQGKCAAAHKVLDYILASMPKLAVAKVARDMLATEAQRCKEGTPVAPPERKAPPAAEPSPADAQTPPAAGEGSAASQAAAAAPATPPAETARTAPARTLEGQAAPGVRPAARPVVKPAPRRTK